MTRIDIRGTAPPGRARLGLALALLVLPVLPVSMDVSVLYLVMPTVTEQLGPSATQQLWILDIYAFLVAGLLITMGNLGDRAGRRRVLLVGAAIFGLASVLAAFAPNAGALIAARALMGVGGAMLLPSSLALIPRLFTEPRARGNAIAVWTAVAAVGSAIGPIIGGVLLHHFWWGSVFLINTPVLLVVLALGPFLLPEHRAGGRGRLDPPSVVLSIAGILSVVYAVKEAAAAGMTVWTAVAGVFGTVVLLVFVRRQRRLAEPLVAPQLFRYGRFRLAVSASLVATLSGGGMGSLTSVYLQSVAGRNALDAALLGIPAAVAIGIFSMCGAGVARRLGLRNAFVVGLGAAAAGNLLLLGTGVAGGIAWYLAGSTIAGVGYGIVLMLVPDLAVAALPPERAGSAVGVTETSLELGNALGLSLLGSLAALVFRSGGDFAPTLGETLGRTGGDPALADAAQHAFVTGMHVATTTGAGLLLFVAATAMLGSRSKPRGARGRKFPDHRR
ncbi:MFS transporter [Nocardia wallacei]|uniref:MFS transporter n=1 Tax=Nocardia wallacei TaxID=480035 RepID=UPI002453D01F|nr:MFS transporter [Nocardia wallacei]